MRKLFVLTVLVLALCSIATPVLAQSDAAFLEGPYGGWYCKHQDGSIWVFIVDDSVYDYSSAVSWCAVHGYSW